MEPKTTLQEALSALQRSIEMNERLSRELDDANRLLTDATRLFDAGQGMYDLSYHAFCGYSDRVKQNICQPPRDGKHQEYYSKGWAEACKDLELHGSVT